MAIIVFLASVLYSVPERSKYLILPVSAVFLVLGVLIMTEGVDCTASFLCYSNSTLIDAGSTMAMLASTVLILGSIINGAGEMRRNERRNGRG